MAFFIYTYNYGVDEQSKYIIHKDTMAFSVSSFATESVPS